MLQGYELHFLKSMPGMPLPHSQVGKICALVFLLTRNGKEAQVTAWLRDVLTPQHRSVHASLIECF
jgi:hypothetical protein